AAQDWMLLRLNADGSLDTTFGSGGLVRTDFDGSPNSLHGIGVQPDGKIVTSGGNFTDQTPETLVVARYDANGTLDKSFGMAGTGVVFGHVAGTNSEGVDVLLQPDGAILVVGLGGRELGVLRFDSTGAPDVSFGTGGLLIEQDAIYRGSALQADGK